MKEFKIHSKFQLTSDQKKAVSKLVSGVNNNLKYQVLLGVTGSGKTFTMANVIEQLQRPTLIISHNKTLAGQLYQELREFFPDNAVSYFVSYYDYYQPEAYIPSTDTYIEKDADINEVIDKLRLAATSNLLTRKDTIVVASVSCIYNIGSPIEYGSFIFELAAGVNVDRKQIINRLISLQYERNDYGFQRGSFRVRGDTIDVFPAYQDTGVRIETEATKIINVFEIDVMTGQILKIIKGNFVLYPAKHFLTDASKDKEVFIEIQKDCQLQVDNLKKLGKDIEAYRLTNKVNYDLDMIKEVGYVKGIENYSRYFDGRKKGDTPYTLLDYFNYPYKNNWNVIVDESHITFPQVRGMYGGDMSRKKTLIEYGFRLPSALDNRPLKFDEFMRRIPNFIATSATPNEWEMDMAKESYHQASLTQQKKVSVNGLTEQLVRPTGIPDPKVEIRPTNNQVGDVIKEIKIRAQKGQRTLVTTLTKKTAEDLSSYLAEREIKVHYLHSDIKTLERGDILEDLRRGNYDCLVGINLLREGLDLPEVTLVAILDADKEGFLRSTVTLIQTMGRAARHIEGSVIMYADTITHSIKEALKEVERRRKIQLAYNREHNITPSSIIKPIRERLAEKENEKINAWTFGIGETSYGSLGHLDTKSLTPKEKLKLVNNLKKEMRLSAQELNFEIAAKIRDAIKELE